MQGRARLTVGPGGQTVTSTATFHPSSGPLGQYPPGAAVQDSGYTGHAAVFNYNDQNPFYRNPLIENDPWPAGGPSAAMFQNVPERGREDHTSYFQPGWNQTYNTGMNGYHPTGETQYMGVDNPSRTVDAHYQSYAPNYTELYDPYGYNSVHTGFPYGLNYRQNMPDYGPAGVYSLQQPHRMESTWKPGDPEYALYPTGIPYANPFLMSHNILNPQMTDGGDDVFKKPMMKRSDNEDSSSDSPKSPTLLKREKISSSNKSQEVRRKKATFRKDQNEDHNVDENDTKGMKNTRRQKVTSTASGRRMKVAPSEPPNKSPVSETTRHKLQPHSSSVNRRASITARVRPGTVGKAKWKTGGVEAELEEVKRRSRRRKMLDQFESRMYYHYELPTICKLIYCKIPELLLPPCLSTTPVYEIALSEA